MRDISRIDKINLNDIEDLYNSLNKLTDEEVGSLLYLKDGELPLDHRMSDKFNPNDKLDGVCSVILVDTGDKNYTKLGHLSIFKALRPKTMYDGGFWFKPGEMGQRLFLVKVVLNIDLLLKSFELLRIYGDIYEASFETILSQVRDSLDTLKDIYKNREGVNEFKYREDKEGFIDVSEIGLKPTNTVGENIVNVFNSFWSSTEERIRMTSEELSISESYIKDFIEENCHKNYHKSWGRTLLGHKTNTYTLKLKK